MTIRPRLAARIGAFAVAVFAVIALTMGAAAPASAAVVATQVPGGADAVGFGQYNGSLYLGTSVGVEKFNGSTFTMLPGSPTNVLTFLDDGTTLWMIADTTPAGNNALWTYDGTTFTQINIALSSSPLILFGGHVYYISGSLQLEDTVLGAVAGLTNVTDFALINPGGTKLAVSAGFSHTLWTYDGATATQLAANPTTVTNIESVSSGVVFSADNGLGPVPFFSDGAIEAPLGGGDSPFSFREYNTKVYFGTDLNPGVQGTDAMFVAAPPTANSSAAVAPAVDPGVPEYAASNGLLYLQAGADYSLYSYDGTTLAQVSADPLGAENFIEFGGVTYFIAEKVAESPSLWKLGAAAVTPPTGPVLSMTGGTVSPVAFVVALAMVLGGAALLTVSARRNPGARHLG